MTTIPTEHEEQKAVILWSQLHAVRYPELALLFAIPNGARVRWGTANKLKAEGLKRGVPDLCLPVPRGTYHGLFLELKRLKHASHHPQQRWWQHQLRQQGYFVVVAAGAERAIHWLQRYLDGAA